MCYVLTPAPHIAKLLEGSGAVSELWADRQVYIIFIQRFLGGFLHDHHQFVCGDCGQTHLEVPQVYHYLFSADADVEYKRILFTKISTTKVV